MLVKDKEVRKYLLNRQLRVSGKQAWTPGRHFMVKAGFISSALAFRELGVWYEPLARLSL